MLKVLIIEGNRVLYLSNNAEKRQRLAVECLAAERVKFIVSPMHKRVR
jgi:hypothetical protein